MAKGPTPSDAELAEMWETLGVLNRAGSAAILTTLRRGPLALPAIAEATGANLAITNGRLRFLTLSGLVGHLDRGRGKVFYLTPKAGHTLAALAELLSVEDAA